MTAETTTDTGAAGPGRGGHMSRRRKRDAVLRLLRGGDLELVSRALGVTAATLSGWRDAFLAAGEARLATRPTDGEALENERLKTKLGEMLLDRELLEAKIAALEAGRPLARRTGRGGEPGRLPCAGHSTSCAGGTFGPAPPSSGKPYGLARVCRVWRLSRATVHRHRTPGRAQAPRRRGPPGPMADAALLEAVRAILSGCPFHGEGHRKVWTRLRMGGVRTSKRRVLRLMGEHDLLAPSRVGSPKGPRNHDW